jgi:hypothetical protein
MLTKKRLQYMKEDSLRREVLIPLLQAMGHQDVTSGTGAAASRARILCRGGPTS